MAAARQHLAPALQPGEARDRKLPMALAAALEAWRHAGCGDRERAAWLSLGLGLEHALLADFAPIFVPGAHPRGRDAHIDWTREPNLPLPDVRFRTPVDLAARAVRRQLGVRGPLNPLGLGGMSRLGATSPRAELDACRPFDRRRDGLVMGEGAAVLVVESLARAQRRGVTPIARILGWGSSQDGYKATAPRPDGAAAAAAMTRALTQAGCRGGDIDYINAHGTGTPLNDRTELMAIERALGPDAARIPISSIKGAVGHSMAAAGAIEVAACVMALSRDTLPGTAHLRDLDPACRIAGRPARILTTARRCAPGSIRTVMSNSFGFGGQNATVILARHTDE
jgi:3-oxoacyl-(acyl-carrier-protein) synthase